VPLGGRHRADRAAHWRSAASRLRLPHGRLHLRAFPRLQHGGSGTGQDDLDFLAHRWSRALVVVCRRLRRLCRGSRQSSGDGLQPPRLPSGGTRSRPSRAGSDSPETSPAPSQPEGKRWQQSKPYAVPSTPPR
jgi:hypothetical protein